MLRRMVAVAALAGAAVAGYRLVVEPWWRGWGVDPGEAEKTLPGDDVVGEPTGVETRGITIDAPAAAVWPWLVQMGYERAGWYSYDAVDMKGRSADAIEPSLQSLAVGEVMPTHPGGGFLVQVLEPERHLVLYLDSAMVAEQARDAAAVDAESPANLRMAGAFMEQSQPTQFAATWAFVLEDPGDGRTRLIERFRVRFGAADDKPWTRLTLPLMGFGVFVMMRKQMLGIRDRAERGPMPELVAA